MATLRSASSRSVSLRAIANRCGGGGLVSSVDAPTALKPQGEGDRVGKVVRVGGREIIGGWYQTRGAEQVTRLFVEAHSCVGHDTRGV
jgi:hypothetical protein